jgi:peptide/nickel transport system substrate-binding protein
VSRDGLAPLSRGGALSRRAFLRLSRTALTAVALERARPRSAHGQERRPRDLVVARGAEVARLDPHYSVESAALFNLYDTLVAWRADNRLHPALAVRWKLLSPTVWEFELRQGVRFHNGDAFTAADVKYSIERTYDPQAKTLVASVFTTVERIETPEPQIVRIQTRSPDPLLPARLACYGGQMLPKRYVEAVGTQGLETRPVGTGPLRFVERATGDRLVTEAVPDYWGGAIDADRVIFKAIPELGPRVAALLRGEVDLLSGLTPDHIDRVTQGPKTKVAEILMGGLYVLAVNSQRPPLDNPLVKQALSLAIDRTAIIQELWHGRGLAPNSLIPRGDRFYEEARPPLPYDPGLARRRLVEAGYRNEEIVLESTAGYLPNDRPMSEAIIPMWRDVGINARVEIVEYSVLAQKIRERSFKGLRWGGPVSTLADPDGFMWRLLSPGAPHDMWRHARFDELGRAARFSVDERFRRDAYREMTDILLEHLPMIPVLQPPDLYGLRRSIDWSPYPITLIDLRRYNLRVQRG